MVDALAQAVAVGALAVQGQAGGIPPLATQARQNEKLGGPVGHRESDRDCGKVT